MPAPPDAPPAVPGLGRPDWLPWMIAEQRATRHLNLHMALEMILLRLRDAVIQPAIPQPA